MEIKQLLPCECFESPTGDKYMLTNSPVAENEWFLLSQKSKTLYFDHTGVSMFPSNMMITFLNHYSWKKLDEEFVISTVPVMEIHFHPPMSPSDVFGSKGK